MITSGLGPLLASVAVLLHGLGLVFALHAVVKVRTPQGSIAWAISLLTFPYVALPLYWVFGPQHFEGYVQSLRQTVARNEDQAGRMRAALRDHHARLADDPGADLAVLERLA